MKLEHEPDLPVAEFREPVAAELQDISPVYGERAGIRTRQCAEYLQQCGLSCPGCPHYGNDFRTFRTEIQSLKHLEIPE